jgi:hypothetical protein
MCRRSKIEAMESENKRRSERVPVAITSFIRKRLPDGGESLMQFVSKDLSEGGLFILTDDLSIFDLSEEVALIVERGRERYFEGKARVVRSARIFASAGSLTESGFGLMFIDTAEEFRSAIASALAESQEGAAAAPPAVST